jgi:hypothetical protein
VECIKIGNAELWHGDMAEVLPQLGKVDAVITDPPMGLLIAGRVGLVISTGGARREIPQLLATNGTQKPRQSRSLTRSSL